MFETSFLNGFGVTVFNFGDFFAVAFDTFKEDLNEIVGVQDFITEEGQYPSRGQGLIP